MRHKLEELLKGNNIITSEKGNSMEPKIYSGQEHELSPCTLDELIIGDIVYCKVNGRFYTHLVKAKGDRGVLIGNNKGRINGWTKTVYGKVIKILN